MQSQGVPESSRESPKTQSVGCCTNPAGSTLTLEESPTDSTWISLEPDQLPNAPLTVPGRGDAPAHFEWNLGTPVMQTDRPFHRPTIWDKKMWAAHMVLAGSMIFDVEVTHEGVAHHRCQEGNLDLHSHPSRGELYRDNLFQFGPIMVMDWLAAKAARNGHLGRRYWKPIGYIGPVYGGFMHFRGGTKWLTNCW